MHIHRFGRAIRVKVTPVSRCSPCLGSGNKHLRVFNKQVLLGLISAQHVIRFPAVNWMSLTPGPGMLGGVETHLLMRVWLRSAMTLTRRQISMHKSKLSHYPED